MFGKIREAFSLEKWVENFEGYLDARIELAKYDARETMVEILTKGIIGFSLAILGLIVLVCLNFAIGYWLSSLLANTYSGFVILTGFYLFLFILLFLNKNNQGLLRGLEGKLRTALNQPKAQVTDSESEQIATDNTNI
jgi:hypothetical protein